MTADQPTQSVIASHTKVIGDIRGAGDLCLCGTCKGDIQVQGRVAVQAMGLLKGHVDAQEIEVQGVVIGELRAQQSIILGPKARVVGALTAPRVEILQGAQFQGPLETQRPEQAKVAQAEQASSSPSSKDARSPKKKVDEITLVTSHRDMVSNSASL